MSFSSSNAAQSANRSARDEASAPLLSIDGLTVEFPSASGPLRAVDGVTLELAAGETLGLVGESGSGKSMTALAAVGLVPPPGRVASGSVRFNGRTITGMTERELRRIRGAGIGFVFQEPMTALNPVFTIGAQLVETLEVHGIAHGREARARAVSLFDAVRLPDPERRFSDYPHQLSGGQRQRALIAMALACSPALLIADEPTTALDVTVQAEILDLLREMKERFGLALLLITHDLGVVAETADRVAVMYTGRIVETAPVADLFRDPLHPYTRGLMRSMPGMADGRELHAIPGTVPPLDQLPPGCTFAPRCPDRFEPCDRARPGDAAVGARRVKCYLHDSPMLDARPAAASGRAKAETRS